MCHARLYKNQPIQSEPVTTFKFSKTTNKKQDFFSFTHTTTLYMSENYTENFELDSFRCDFVVDFDPYRDSVESMI